ncbi:mRNA capping enzyme beta chain [Gregarina niphandrodes]|uniref:mRNA 5'-phosphatase n=1 Tax=Gregarina niphandrodes TaxID=110365 RepID=A0A023B6N0_GRENI|nr:mRNA capping enzyme beta chain [Gregarina niphandrodes]EZG66637.1 mRNA capping enzyme beta chain [Gregarina niphandrodes]|eukprot:XP_011130566.1 mRNA capping enzyme beta chain [Gregarina niphandrodes]
MKFSLLDGSELKLDDTTISETIGEIGYYLDEILENGGSPSELEVEGRLGIISETHSDDRIKLPIETETLLQDIPFEFDHRFIGSVSEHQFYCLLKELCKRFGIPKVPFTDQPIEYEQSTADAAEESEQKMDTADGDISGDIGATSKTPSPKVAPKSHAVQQLLEPMFIETSDVFVLRKVGKEETRCRVSRNPGTGDIIEGIIKEPKLKLNVYTGRDPHEYEVEVLLSEAGQSIGDNTRTSADYRISINREIEVPRAECSQLLRFNKEKLFTRNRRRVTLPIFGVYRLDCTIVNTSGGQGNKQSYEMELEINPWVLYYHHIKKRQGDPDEKFTLIVANFIEMMRSLVACLTTSGTQELIRSTAKGQTTQVFECDLRDCAVPPEVLDKYLKQFSPVVPLIGDYSFRLETGVVLTEADVEDSCRMHLSPQELAELQERNRARLQKVYADCTVRKWSCEDLSLLYTLTPCNAIVKDFVLDGPGVVDSVYVLSAEKVFGYHVHSNRRCHESNELLDRVDPPPLPGSAMPGHIFTPSSAGECPTGNVLVNNSGRDTLVVGLTRPAVALWSKTGNRRLHKYQVEQPVLTGDACNGTYILGTVHGRLVGLDPRSAQLNNHDRKDALIGAHYFKHLRTLSDYCGLTNSSDQILRFWDWRKMDKPWAHHYHQHQITSVDTESPDLLVFGDQDGNVLTLPRLWVGRQYHALAKDLAAYDIAGPHDYHNRLRRELSEPAPPVTTGAVADCFQGGVPLFPEFSLYSNPPAVPPAIMSQRSVSVRSDASREPLRTPKSCESFFDDFLDEDAACESVAGPGDGSREVAAETATGWLQRVGGVAALGGGQVAVGKANGDIELLSLTRRSRRLAVPGTCPDAEAVLLESKIDVRFSDGTVRNLFTNQPPRGAGSLRISKYYDKVSLEKGQPEIQLPLTPKPLLDGVTLGSQWFGKSSDQHKVVNVGFALAYSFFAKLSKDGQVDPKAPGWLRDFAHSIEWDNLWISLTTPSGAFIAGYIDSIHPRLSKEKFLRYAVEDKSLANMFVNVPPTLCDVKTTHVPIELLPGNNKAKDVKLVDNVISISRFQTVDALYKFLCKQFRAGSIELCIRPPFVPAHQKVPVSQYVPLPASDIMIGELSAQLAAKGNLSIAIYVLE